MIISVASGKGGTGKTTVATNLAMAVGEGVMLLDCDVEEPNAHLFLKPRIEHRETAYVPVPEIDAFKCTYCRKCVDICRFKAIAIAGDAVLTFPELCHGCGGCIAVCPENAITEKGRELGVLEKGARGAVEFAHGKLRIGEAMAPPLINKVRAFTNSHRMTIVDAPPGTSCPVIAAIKHTDFVLMVTEPTPFGLHDLKLAVEAVKILGIRHGLIINRADMGNDDVRHYARAEDIPVLMEIPFQRSIAERYARGELLVESAPEWREAFVELAIKIENLAA